jgi:hypothetical protein
MTVARLQPREIRPPTSRKARLRREGRSATEGPLRGWARASHDGRRAASRKARRRRIKTRLRGAAAPLPPKAAFARSAPSRGKAACRPSKTAFAQSAPSRRSRAPSAEGGLRPKPSCKQHQQREHDGNDDHRCDRRIEAKAWTLDANVTGQLAQPREHAQPHERPDDEHHHAAQHHDNASRRPFGHLDSLSDNHTTTMTSGSLPDPKLPIMNAQHGGPATHDQLPRSAIRVPVRAALSVQPTRRSPTPEPVPSTGAAR